MPWIESHSELKDHPKMRRFTRMLGVPLPSAIGHLHLLWWYCLEYAEDGDVSYDRFTMEDIAEITLWPGDPHVLVDALHVSGFLEKDGERLVIHDWYDYAGKYIELRKANAARMREARAAKEKQTTKPRAKNVQRTSDARSRLPDLTRPNQTEPNQTIEETPNGVADKPPSAHKALAITLAVTEGYAPDARLTKTEWGRFGKASSELLALGATEDEVRLRADRYLRAHPEWEYTANALVSHWGKLASEPPPRASPNGNGHSSRATRIDAADRFTVNGKEPTDERKQHVEEVARIAIARREAEAANGGGD